ANFGAISLNSFLVIAGLIKKTAACRRAANVSFFPSVIIFSATGRVALARVSVVLMRPCSNRLVTRLRSVARRCHGLRPSFDPDFRCLIVSSLSSEAELCLRPPHWGVGALAPTFCPCLNRALVYPEPRRAPEEMVFTDI